MRFTVLFVLLASLAFSLVSASKDSGNKAVESLKRVKRTYRWGPPPYMYAGYYPYGRPIVYY